MKKLYLMMSVLLACGLFCACSDEEDIVVENYDNGSRQDPGTVRTEDKFAEYHGTLTAAVASG